jgi:predicted RecA/RadA family phage recombinase
MAKATFVQKGDNIDFTAAADIAYMDVVTLTDRIGVALENIANGATGTVTLTGVFEFPAATGSGKALTVGQKVYWDATNSVITPTATDNIFAGYAVAAKAAATAVARVRIG